MIRKLTLIITLISVLVFTFSAASFAGEKVLFQSDEIKDIKVLQDRIKNGVTDDINDKKFYKAALKNAPDDVEVKTGVTTQKLKEVQKSDGTIATDYVTTAVSDIKQKNLRKTPGVASLGYDWLKLLASSGSWDENDSSISVRHVATYYYSKYTDSSGMTWVDPGSSNYKWYLLDSTVSVTKGIYGCSWYDVSGGGNNYQTIYSISYGSTYYRPDPLSRYVNCSQAASYVAFKQESTIKRGTYTWDFQSDMIWEENLWP